TLFHRVVSYLSDERHPSGQTGSSCVIHLRWPVKLNTRYDHEPCWFNRRECPMPIVNNLKMLLIVVSDMPKPKAVYAATLGLHIPKDYRQDDTHWWVSLALPEGGASLNLSTYRENVTPGTISLYFVTSDVAAAHQQLSQRGAQVSAVQDDLYGPGSGVQWFN